MAKVKTNLVTMTISYSTDDGKARNVHLDFSYPIDREIARDVIRGFDFDIEVKNPNEDE